MFKTVELLQLRQLHPQQAVVLRNQVHPALIGAGIGYSRSGCAGGQQQGSIILMNQLVVRLPYEDMFFAQVF